MVSEVTVRKNSKQILPKVEKVIVSKLFIRSRTVTSNHKAKYLKSVDLLFLIKNTMLGGFY